MNEPHGRVGGRQGDLNGLIALLRSMTDRLRQVSEAPTNEPQSNEVPVLRFGQGDYQRDYFFEDDNS